MPRVSEREKLLHEVDQALNFAAIDDLINDDGFQMDSADDSCSSEEEEESMFQSLSTLHYLVSENKYLNPRKTLAKSWDYVLNYFLHQPDDQFRKITRVSRPTFNHILQLIQDNPTFPNDSSCAQVPVHWQLACALDRIGNDGQGVSHARSKIIWGIGQGIVHLYTTRVIKALWDLRDTFIQWPSPEERLKTSRRLELKGFKHCVGFIDGTTIPIHKKPTIHGNVYMDRKKRYFVNAQIACDDQNRIFFFMTGWPGSSGDSLVFSGSFIAQRPDLAFSPKQYLLSDSAYAATPTIIPAYRSNNCDDRTDPQEPRAIQKFNTYLAKARVMNEHTIGIVKAPWTSMKGMRIDLHHWEDMTRFVHQATVCIILHNICIQATDPWEEEFYEDEEEDEADGSNLPRQSRILSPGQRRRWEVRKACLAYQDRG